MTEDDSQGETQQRPTVSSQLEVGEGGTDGITHDEREAEYRDARHAGLDVLEVLAMAEEVVEQTTHGNGQQRDYQDVLEHTPGIDGNLFARQPIDHERGDNRRQERADGGHANREGNVTFAEERHDVARHAARTTAYQDDADAEFGREVEDLGQPIGYKRHHSELRQRAETDVQRTLQEDAEVVGRQGATHREHDDAQDDVGQSVLLDPIESVGPNGCQYGCQNNYSRGVMPHEVTDGLKESKHGEVCCLVQFAGKDSER